MIFSDDYQWRYRRPAPSVHEVVAEIAAGRRSDRHPWRRRAIVALMSLLLAGLLTCVMEQTATAQVCPLLSASRADDRRHRFEVPALPALGHADADLTAGVHGSST